jgi:hypothetical protein
MDGAGDYAKCQGSRADKVPRPARLLACAGGGYLDKLADGLPKRGLILDFDGAPMHCDTIVGVLENIAELGHQILLVKI